MNNQDPRRMSKELKKKELIFKKQIDFNVATVNCFQTYISTIGFFIDNGKVLLPF